MSELTYRVGELKQLIKESSSEFKAKMGTNVEKDNKANNEKAYKDAEKRAKDFDGGLKKQEKKTTTNREDYNGSMLDIDTDNEVSPETKERIKLQASGYISKKAKDNGI